MKRTLANRYFSAAAVAGLRWLVNPVSEGGAKQVPRVKLLAGGPEIRARIVAMRDHPDGRRILADRPELGARLGQMDRLAALPEGTFGRVFHDYMDHPDGIPGYILASLVYKDGFLDSYDLSDEERYFIERNLWLHDMLHVLTGYGTDLAGEGLLLHFDCAYQGGLSYRAAVLLPFGLAPRFLLRPSIGMRHWSELLRDANRRGHRARSTCEPQHVYWEELLERPLDEVRERLGIATFTTDTSSFLAGSILGRSASSGFGVYEKQLAHANVVRRLVEAGVPYRELMRASTDTVNRMAQMESEGADGLCSNCEQTRIP
jgi:ubiquinone biosynthesis protein COQ4